MFILCKFISYNILFIKKINAFFTILKLIQHQFYFSGKSLGNNVCQRVVIFLAYRT